MTLHMAEISQCVPENRHAVVIMDGAMWHHPSINQHNVTMLKLPPYSPELNPVEQVWQTLKQYRLHNRCYKNFDEIVDVACDAWNWISQQPEKLKSLTTRQWCHI